MHLKTNFDPFAEGGFISPGSGCLSSTGSFGTVGGVPSGGWKSGAKKTNVDYDIPAPSISCGAAALPDSADPSDPNIITVHSGWHSSKEPTKSGTTYIFEPGNHCLLAGINLNATVANIKNVNFKVEADEFRLKIGDLTCENMLVYINGGTGVTFDGNGNITCTGATFYAQTGDVKWTGNPNMTLSAPTSGTYQGLLIYLPDDPTPNSSAVKIGGTSNIQVTGSIIAPKSPVSLSGTSNSNGFDTQVVGNKINLEGTSNTLIKYNPANQFHPPAKPTIDLTK